MAKANEQKRTSRRKKKTVSTQGRAYIQSTMNNTIITLTDDKGDVVSWGSAGVAGYKGSRKSTPYAAQVAAGDAAQKALDLGLREVEVYLKGIGSGRESALRALRAAGLAVIAIADITPIPHNGCRSRKPRRV